VIEDTDGSLLVIDTGGWYKICCPTSQLAKPDVLGGTYRVRRKGALKIKDPRGLEFAWASMKPGDLVQLLGDQRPVVRDRAIAELAKRGEKAVPAARQLLRPRSSNAGAGATELEARRNAVWALTRIDSPAAREGVRDALHDQDVTVRQAAIHSISLWHDADAVKPLLAILRSSTAQLQRVAAEALGRIGDKSAVPALLAATSQTHASAAENASDPAGRLTSAATDRALEHSLIYALIEMDDREAVLDALRQAGQASRLPPRSGGDPSDSSAPDKTANPIAAGAGGAPALLYRAALIALDQMDDGVLKPETVTPLLTSADPLLQQTASWIVGHHPDWGDALAGYFRERLAAENFNESDRAQLLRQLAQLARHTTIQQLLAEASRQATRFNLSRSIALRAMAQASLKEIPAAWADALHHCLTDGDETIVRAAVDVVRSLPTAKTNAVDFSEPLPWPRCARASRPSNRGCSTFSARASTLQNRP